MISALKNMVSNVFSPSVVQSQSVSVKAGYNPFENPFVQKTQNSSYGINKPVKGGYFAGYYNGKPNIVGRRLFIEA